MCDDEIDPSQTERDGGLNLIHVEVKNRSAVDLMTDSLCAASLGASTVLTVCAMMTSCSHLHHETTREQLRRADVTLLQNSVSLRFREKLSCHNIRVNT